RLVDSSLRRRIWVSGREVSLAVRLQDEPFYALPGARVDERCDERGARACRVVELVPGGKGVELHDRVVVDVRRDVSDLRDRGVEDGRVVEADVVAHRMRKHLLEIHLERDAVFAERRVV